MSYKDYWEVSSRTEALLKVVGRDYDKVSEDEDTAAVIAGDIRGGKALEIGAGYGRLMKQTSKYFDDVYGVDISDTLISMSKEFLKDSPRCRPIVKTDGVSLPFEDGLFDFVYSFICFQHMPTIAIVRKNISEIFRVLKPAGRCAIQTIQDPPIDRDDTPNGAGRTFSSGEDFFKEFKAVGFVGSVTVGKGHPKSIWVEASRG